MKSIAFHIEKGGTGKTTMAGNVGHELAALGFKTVIADGDPQGNLSSWLVHSDFDAELADVLEEEATVYQAIVQVREFLHVLPTFGVGGGLKDFAESKLFRQPFAFADLRDRIDKWGADFLVWDLGPGISELERAILATCDEVIPVTMPEFFSVDGLEIFTYHLDKLRKERRAEFTTTKLVMNRVNRAYSYHKAYAEQLGGLGYELFTVGQSTDVSDGVPNHQVLTEYNPGNRYAGEIQRLAKAVV